MKLHYKLYLFFAGIVLLPLMVATIAASVMLARSGTETYENRIRSSLAASSAIISGQAQVLAGDFQTSLPAADTSSLSSGDPARMAPALRALADRSGAAAADITDEHDNAIVTTGAPMAAAPPMISSSAKLLGLAGAQWHITVYRPFDTDALASVFASQGLEWGLLDNGSVALGSLPAGQEVTADVSRNETEPEQSPKQSGDDFYQARSDGEELLASSLEIPQEISSRDTVLFAAVRDNIVGAASEQALTVGIAIMLALSMLAAALGYLLTRTITSPIRELNEAATAGIEGNLERRVEIQSHDELGGLADSFNKMQESIQLHISDLKESRAHLLRALAYTGEILGSTADRDRLVKTTAEAAKLATGACAIWVELFESQGPAGRKAVSGKVPAYFFEGEAAATAHQLSLDVIAGKVKAGDTVAFDSEKNMMAFPMVYDQKAIGTLVAVFNRSLPLEQSSKQILSSLSQQAASALENVILNDQQRKLAITDHLTGLYNFRYLNDYLGRELRKSRRYKHQFTLAIIDLDDFKDVNDSYGHLAGDELLEAVAGVLRDNVREADMVARYGGEEFAIVLPETSKTAALGVMEKLRAEISKTRPAEYPEVRITASIGVASYPLDSDSQVELLKLADEALYRSKMSGKNQVSAARPLKDARQL